ncbi:Nucleosome assembly protein 1-like 4, partial [Trichinella zimbabwensis]
LQIISPSAEVLFISARFRVKFVGEFARVAVLSIKLFVKLCTMLENSVADSDTEDSVKVEDVSELLSNYFVDQHFRELASMPQCVLKRVNALKRLQLEMLKNDVDFQKSMLDLEYHFNSLQAPLREKRRQIITGEYEPDEAETEVIENDEFIKSFNVVRETILEKSPELREMVAADIKGVPDFWATVLRNGEYTGELVNPNDEILLKSLTNIEVRYSKDPEGFSLHFFFDENDYFTNTELTKHYITTTEMKAKNPFDYNGTRIVGRKGCKIDWKPGKNLTVKLVKKRRKGKTGNCFVPKEITVSSFFNFFDPKYDTDDVTEVDEEQKDYLEEDIEVAEVIRDQLVPNAVLFFTGEAVEQDDFDDEETADFDKSETETDEDY